jgi:hypothetical protein
MKHSDLIAIEKGEFCTKHKIILSEDGNCEACLLARPAWNPPHSTKAKKDIMSWIWWILVVFGIYGLIAWHISSTQ